MATSSYLSNYGVYKETDSFKVTFDIPDNCEHSTFVDSEGTNIITVNLISGAKDPSGTFVSLQETYTCDLAGELAVAFELPEEYGVGLAKKPKIMVRDLIE